jgi:hypothetical protein
VQAERTEARKRLLPIPPNVGVHCKLHTKTNIIQDHKLIEKNGNKI